MRIWWCQEHDVSGGDERYCADVDRYTTHCRMVPMRLIPDNAIVINRPDGEWPLWAIEAVSGALDDDLWTYVDILNALAAHDEETA